MTRSEKEDPPGVNYITRRRSAETLRKPEADSGAGEDMTCPFFTKIFCLNFIIMNFKSLRSAQITTVFTFSRTLHSPLKRHTAVNKTIHKTWWTLRKLNLNSIVLWRLSVSDKIILQRFINNRIHIIKHNLIRMTTQSVC